LVQPIVTSGLDPFSLNSNPGVPKRTTAFFLPIKRQV